MVKNTKTKEAPKSRGRPKKIKKETFRCWNCGSEYEYTEFYSSTSVFFQTTGRLPYCKKCVEELFNHYVKEYGKYSMPVKRAVQRICVAFDIYYSDEVYERAEEKKSKKIDIPMIAAYFSVVGLNPYRNKRYDDTMIELEQSDIQDFNDGKTDGKLFAVSEKDNIPKSVIKFFGEGFSAEDYNFLNEQYSDWTARHECNTKSQEEVFKQICFNQLELLKANRAGLDTKDLNATFLKLLDSAKLQPKQNSGETVSDAQTFGTLIDKWENTRPLPEIDEELKDVDKIGWYLEIFFRGHLSKMMGIKNGFSKIYNDFISKYSVTKPEYDNEDENSEVLFDAIFGGVNNNE